MNEPRETSVCSKRWFAPITVTGRSLPGVEQASVRAEAAMRERLNALPEKLALEFLKKRSRTLRRMAAGANAKLLATEDILDVVVVAQANGLVGDVSPAVAVNVQGQNFGVGFQRKNHPVQGRRTGACRRSGRSGHGLSLPAGCDTSRS